VSEGLARARRRGAPAARRAGLGTAVGGGASSPTAVP